LAHQVHVERDLDQLDIGDQLAELNRIGARQRCSQPIAQR